MERMNQTCGLQTHSPSQVRIPADNHLLERTAVSWSSTFLHIDRECSMQSTLYACALQLNRCLGIKVGFSDVCLICPLCGKRLSSDDSFHQNRMASLFMKQLYMENPKRKQFSSCTPCMSSL